MGEPFDEIVSMFPALGKEIIEAVFDKQGHNVDKTINALLEFNKVHLSSPPIIMERNLPIAREKMRRRRRKRNKRTSGRRNKRGTTVWAPLEPKWNIKEIPTLFEREGKEVVCEEEEISSESSNVLLLKEKTFESDCDQHIQTDEVKKGEKETETEKRDDNDDKNDDHNEKILNEEENSQIFKELSPLFIEGVLKDSTLEDPSTFITVKLYLQKLSQFRRLKLPSDKLFSRLVEVVMSTQGEQKGEKVSSSCEEEGDEEGEEFKLIYTDEEGDRITMKSEKDVEEALRIHRNFLWKEGKPQIFSIFVLTTTK